MDTSYRVRAMNSATKFTPSTRGQAMSVAQNGRSDDIWEMESDLPSLANQAAIDAYGSAVAPAID